MTDIDLALLAAAIIIGVASYRVPRSTIWIALAAVDFAVSTWYWRSGLPYAEGVAGTCDGIICLCVYFLGRERWEMGVWRLFQISVAINFFFLAGSFRIFPMVSHDVYSSMLEAVNWLLLLLIGGTAVMQRIGADVGARRSWDHVHYFARALRAERTRPAFYKVP